MQISIAKIWMCIALAGVSFYAPALAQEPPENGPYKEYYEGTQQVRLETTYVNGEPHGNFRQYFLSGRLMAVGSYRNGEYNGPYKE